MAGQDRVGAALQNVSPLLNNAGAPAGRNAWNMQDAQIMQMRDPDPTTARMAWELGVQDGYVDPRLSPAAASWWVDVQRGIPITDAPPEVQQELAVYRREAAASPFAGYPSPEDNLIANGRAAARNNTGTNPSRLTVRESQNNLPGAKAR